MNKEQAKSYRKEVAELLLSEKDCAQRSAFLADIKNTPEFIDASRVYLDTTRESREEKLRQLRLPLPSPSTTVDIIRPNVIEDAIAEAKELSERPLTKTQQDILWARSTLKEFESTSTTTNAERNARVSFIAQTAKSVLKDPEKMEIASAIWKTHDKEEPDSFYKLIKDRCAREARMQWKQITSEQLAQFVSIYAHNELIADLPHDILKGYFKGPQHRNDRVSAHYNFTYGILDLIEDPIALEDGVKIGLFESDILPRDHFPSFYADFCQTKIDLADPKTFQRAYISDSVVYALIEFTSLDAAEIRAKTTRFEQEQDLQPNTDRSDRQRNQIVKKGINRFGRAGYLAKMQALANYNELEESFFVDPAKAGSLVRQFPFDVLHDPADPLREKCNQIVQPLLGARAFEKVAREYAMTKGASEDLVNINIPLLDDGLGLGVLLPSSLAPKKSEVVRELLGSAGLVDHVKNEIASYSDYVALAPSSFDFKGTKIYYNFRGLTRSESAIHPLEALQIFGYPLVDSIDGKTIQQVNSELAQSIEQNRVRFLDKRGARIPLTHPELRRLGYQHIDFHKDSDDPQKTRVVITVNNVALEVKLDKKFNFDFEGKSCDITQISESLRFNMLSILEQILCRDKARDSEGKFLDLKKIFKGRTGHLRFLDEGENRGVDRVQECFMREGHDLNVLSEQRKRKYKTERNSTYVKPSAPDNPHHAPVVINIKLPERHLEDSELADIENDLMEL